MRTIFRTIRRIEFEGRIFVSFALAALVLVLSEVLHAGTPTTVEQLGAVLGLDAATALRVGFLIAAGILLVATVLRMWGGSVLTAKRVMAFAVQDDALKTRGPYRFSRNPIYLADLLACTGFALVLKPIGLLLPVLLYAHYRQLIAHEEAALARRFGERYEDYLTSAARFVPGPRSLAQLPTALSELELNADGIRHDALYVLFLPGLCVAAATGQLWHALAIGLPGVLDWAVVHTRIGLPRRSARQGG